MQVVLGMETLNYMSLSNQHPIHGLDNVTGLRTVSKDFIHDVSLYWVWRDIILHGIYLQTHRSGVSSVSNPLRLYEYVHLGLTAQEEHR
jgi:hypothetical protein